MTDTHPLWPRLAELPLVVDGYELEGLSAEMANGTVRLTIVIGLRGAGHEGLGEDVSPFPDDLPEVAGPLAPHVGRVSYDALIHSVDDLATTPVSPIHAVNIKPCRTGGLRALLDLYAYCEAAGIAMYGGGMGENGVGRGQIQLLGSIFHPDGPNDVAPSPFNLPDPPAGLPTSPLAPQPEPIGFRRAT